jgi:hypothetical protein
VAKRLAAKGNTQRYQRRPVEQREQQALFFLDPSGVAYR